MTTDNKTDRWHSLLQGQIGTDSLADTLRKAAGECEKLEARAYTGSPARIARLEAALEWYAKGRHIDHSHGHLSGTYLKVEDGKLAREALDENAT